MRMKKRLILILVSLLLIGSFAACDMEFGGLVGELLGEGNVHIGEQPIEPGGAPDEQYTDVWGDIPQMDETLGPVVDLPIGQYEGQVLTVLCNTSRMLGNDDPENDTVGHLTYKRKQIMEEKYGIVIESKLLDDGMIADEICKQAAAGVSDFDLVYGKLGLSGTQLAQKRAVHNLYDLPWVDFSTVGWNEELNESLAIGNYLPMAAGALTPEVMLYTATIAFNVRLAEEQGIYMYEYVYEGGWTIEKMHAMIEMMYQDLNADGIANADADRFGLVGTLDSVQAFACGMDVSMVEKDENNLPVIATDIDRAVAAYDRFFKLVTDRSSAYGMMLVQNTSNSLTATNVFEHDRALFCTTNVKELFLLADAEYGILPYPKMDLEDADYHSYVGGNASAVMIPVSVEDPEFAGYMLQALNQESAGLYQSNVAARICRSADDNMIFDVMMDSQTFDFACVYLTYSQANKVDLFRVALESGTNSVASLFATNQKTLDKALKKLIDATQE